MERDQWACFCMCRERRFAPPGHRVSRAEMDYLIAARRERPGDDPIFALNAEARRRHAAGEDVINATIGALLYDDGSLATMSSVVEALRSNPPAEAAAYAPIAGRADFRQAVIDDILGEHGLADQAISVATPGGSGALRLALDNFLEPNQSVLTTSFYWGPYRTLADESGHRLHTYNMFDANKRFDVDALDRALGEGVKRDGRVMLFLNTPCHNPTGYSMDAAEWADTIAVIERHAKAAPITVLTDIAYGYYAPEALRSCVHSCSQLVGKALVLFAWSASKSFAQYGLRVGALIALVDSDQQRERIFNALSYSCRGTWSNCNSGGQAAITRVLNEPILNARSIQERAKLVGMLNRRVEHWNELASAAGLNYPRYDGGFFTTVFCDHADEVAAKLRQQGVFVVPLKGALRVAMCAVSEPQIERIVSALAAAL